MNAPHPDLALFDGYRNGVLTYRIVRSSLPKSEECALFEAGECIGFGTIKELKARVAGFVAWVTPMERP